MLKYHLGCFHILLILFSGCSQPRLTSTDYPIMVKPYNNRSKLPPDLPKTKLIHLKDNIAIKLVLLPAGDFIMGMIEGKSRLDSERPPHHVKITKPFYMGMYEVTQAEYSGVMLKNPSRFRGDRKPVENISWDDAVAFCDKLSKLSNHKVRLPTEAEWEYACRANNHDFNYSMNRYLRPDIVNLRPSFYYANNKTYVYRAKTLDVGSFAPNDFGLYDMHGNVAEWCSDWFDENYYRVSPTNDPQGLLTGKYKVIKGGAWCDESEYCRITERSWFPPSRRNYSHGFRIVVEVPAVAAQQDRCTGPAR